jgi:hypothetical protein
MALEFRAAKDLQPIIDRIIELFYPLLQGATVRAVYRSTKFPDSPFTVARIEKITGLRAWLYSKIDGEQEAFFLIQIVVPNWEATSSRGSTSPFSITRSAISITTTRRIARTAEASHR